VLASALRAVALHLGVPAPMVLTATSNKQELTVRFALRDDVDGLRQALRFPLRTTGAYPPLLASAYFAGKDLRVEDCFSAETAQALPSAYFEALGAPALVVCACICKGVTPALLLLQAEDPESLPDPARVAELAELRPLIARAAGRA